MASMQEGRVQQFKETVTALNEQFYKWATKQWGQSPSRFWSTGMQASCLIRLACLLND
jgi:hypothetical protein